MTTKLSTLLVFSDLDGSLLDHYTYSFQEALPVVNLLEQLNIPLVLASSKTRAEIIALRTALGNRHPFIVENGAAVFIPQHYFPKQPADTEVRGEYWVHEMAPPRTSWLTKLGAMKEEFGSQFSSFHSAGVAGIMEMTGLSESQARKANDRDYSEPVKWLGDPQGESKFIQRLRDSGATVARGGRFISVSGRCDKGQALTWLRARYQETSSSHTVEDLAIGDSDNDLPMLEAAGTALMIRSPSHDFPSLSKISRVIHSHNIGPAGWAEGVSQWLKLNNITV